jgi:S-adenosylmethionine hydrolase
MIVLCTDFGVGGPYVGQVRAVLARAAPQVPVIELFADLPPFRPDLAAYLLAAYGLWFEPGDVILAVVDPGVGSARAALAVEADGRWFVGPDNGSFELVLRRARRHQSFAIDWRPERLAPTFHGRDLFAPVAARLAQGEALPASRLTAPRRFAAWPDDLPAIVYLDPYGNAITGLRAASLAEGTVLEVAGQVIGRARVFADRPAGEPLWYENANGLAELAIAQGSAAAQLGLAPGTEVTVRPPRAAHQNYP